jgi:UPF0755 protein
MMRERDFSGPERGEAGWASGDGALRKGRISPRSPRQALQPEQVPPPPPRSRQARHPLVVVLNFFIMAGVLVVLFAGAGLYLGKMWFERPGPLDQTKTVVIARGDDLDTIASRLERQNVVSSGLLFNAAVQFSKVQDKLKAGEYLFEPRVSMREVMDTLVSGKSILQAVTIPEGWTSEQVVARLRESDALTGEIAEIPPEGSLLPDTYKFTRGATRQQVIEQMRQARDKALDEIWERRAPDLPVRTKEEFVTLASIVEKETGKADERSRVAAVFINRLNRNMRLQSDPTIIYGLFGGKGKPSDRPIFQSDIEKETPYNTYAIDGLPPGPIANPGRAALESVANPSRTEDLYFVADGTGGHVFAETLEEHNRNVARWRKVEQAQRDAAAAAGSAAAVAGEVAPAEENPDAKAATTQ